MSVKDNTGISTDIQQYIKTGHASFVRRLAVILLLLYFAAMVDVGRHVYGNVEQGFYFTYLGYEIFPLPYTWGVILPVIVDLDPLRSFIYFTFIRRGMWVLWVLIGIIYILDPLLHWAFNIRREQESKVRLVRSGKGERIGVITGLVAVIAVYLSVATYRINLGNYGLLPLIVVSSLSIVVIGFMAIEILNILRRKNWESPAT